MVKLIDGLDLEKILCDVSNASPEFKSLLRPEARQWDEFFGEPTVRIFPDTNIYSNKKEFIDCLNFQARNHPAKIEIDKLTIIDEELQQDGLKKYNNNLPECLFRGEKALLSKCIMPSELKEEVRQFYDIATQSYSGIVSSLFRFHDMHGDLKNGVAAQDFMKSQKMKFKEGMQQAYHSMFTDLLKNKEKGNETNYVADKILTLTNFGINFFSSRSASVVLTADGDLEALENFTWNNVLPKYVALRAEKLMDIEAPGRWLNLGIAGTDKLESWAKKQLRAGLELAKPEQHKQLTNIIYNCNSGNVYVGYVHLRIKDFVSDTTVGLAKSYVAERSILDRVDPNGLIQHAKDNAQSYEEWLADLKKRK
jgi:hypothetical protein